MKLYRISLADTYGKVRVVTVMARNIDDAYCSVTPRDTEYIESVEEV